jgi:hypothetical protein
LKTNPEDLFMKMNPSSLLCILLLSFSGLTYAQEASPPETRLALRDGWALQSSGKVEAKGETVSTPAFRPKDWYAVSVPTTVVSALVKQKVYPDPFFGTNLRTFPGVTYPIGANFSNIPMQPDSPFIVPWWYRKQFVLPTTFRGKTIWLNFGGINYRANIWLNGKQLAKSEDVAGAWRCGYHNQRARCFALSHRGFNSRFAGPRQGPPDRQSAGEECRQSPGQGDAQRPDREDRIFAGGRTWARRVEGCDLCS